MKAPVKFFFILFAICTGFFSFAQSASAASTLTQRAYVFLNDNGATVDAYTRAHSAATSTAITNVRKGERMIVRIQVDNTGANTASSTYRLQWENNTDTPNTWNDLSTTTAISWSLSNLGALKARYGIVPLPTSQVTTCTSGTTYTSGQFVGSTATSAVQTLTTNQCTDLAFAIQTASSTSGKTYRLRLVTGSTTSALNTYTQYPTFTIEPNQNIRFSKGLRGAYATSSIDLLGDVGLYTSMAVGSDGYPVIAYYDNTIGINNLNFAKCSNASCSSYATSSLDRGGDVGSFTSIAIGSDGYPVISYYDTTNGNLNFAKCNNISCSSYATSTLDAGGDVGQYNTSIAIGSDGFPVISYYDFTNGNLNFAKCNNISCSSYATSSIDQGGDIGYYSAVTMGSDGYPVISYYDFSKGNLNFAKCNNVSCSSYATSSLDQGGDIGPHTSIVIGGDGYPMVSYYDQTNGNLNFAKCNNISCSSLATSSLDSGGDVGQYTSLAIGSDGYPVISYFDNTNGNLNFAKCNNISCSSLATSSLDTAGVIGLHTSLTIGADGFPEISYYDGTNGNLNFVKCNSIDCRTAASSTANLPPTNVDLDSYLDDAGYGSVATIDAISDTLTVASSSRGAYLFTKKFIATTTQNINVVWTGQESIATTTYLKIYNQTTAQWEVLGSSSTQSNATTFSITGIQSTNLKNYYDTSVLLSLRLETGTTTRPLVLSTDAIAINLVALGTTTQRAYVFMNDDLGNVASSTKSHSGATSTPITLVKKGEKLIALIQIDNSAVQTSASTTRAYRLQWENNTDAPNTWTDVGTGGDIRWSYSDKGALTSRYGQVPLNTRQVATCNASAPTYTSGRFVAATNQSTIFALGPQQCSELGFAIQTSAATLGKTYRLRLIDGTANQLLDAYVAYPTMTIEATQNIRYSREVRGGYGTSTLDVVGVVPKYTSIAIGSDGFPVIAFYDTNKGDLKFGKCSNITCSSWATSTLDAGGDVGSYNSIAIGSDGYPVIAYYDTTNGNLNFAKCNNLSCSSFATSSLDQGGDVGQYTSIAIGADGFPVISYYDNTNFNLNFVKCNSLSCSSVATSSLDQAGTVGSDTSIAIGSDGFPVTSYLNQSSGNLSFAKCNTVSCSSFSTSTLDSSSSVFGYSSLTMGSDGFPIMSYSSLPGANSYILVKKCNNVSCTSFGSVSIDIQAGVDLGQYNSLAIGSDGYPVIAYADTTNGHLNFAKCSDSACASVATSSLDQGGTVGSYPSIAIGSDGFPVMVYMDGANGNINVGHCSSIDCRTSASSSANLPGSASDLDSYLDDVGYTNVATNDSIFDSVSGATSTQFAYVFSKHDTVNTDQITATWIGQVSLATSTYLQVYDNILAKWIGFATNTTPTANTNFTLTTTLTTNLSNYYDSSFNVAVRVVTGTTTQATTLRTDQITITLGAAGSANQTLIHYRWRNDNGTEVAATYAQAEDAPVPSSSDVYKGDRRRLRFTVSNAGSASASNITYRLEYASSSCTSWLPVPAYNTQTSQEWVTDLSGYLPEGAVTTHSSGMSVPPGKTFTAGEARLFTNQTTAHTLTSSQYTEHEFALRSTTFAQSNLLYCFRLTNAGSITNFTYATQPQVTLNPNARPQSGGTGSDPTGAGTPRAGGVQSGGAPVDPPAVGVPHGGGGQNGGGGDSG